MEENPGWGFCKESQPLWGSGVVACFRPKLALGALTTDSRCLTLSDRSVTQTDLEGDSVEDVRVRGLGRWKATVRKTTPVGVAVEARPAKLAGFGACKRRGGGPDQQGDMDSRYLPLTNNLRCKSLGGATRAEDAQETPTQSHSSPRILEYTKKDGGGRTWKAAVWRTDQGGVPVEARYCVGTWWCGCKKRVEDGPGRRRCGGRRARPCRRSSPSC